MMRRLAVVISIGMQGCQASPPSTRSPFDTLDWISSGEDSGVAHAQTQVPLDWDNPDAGEISYFLRRALAPRQPSRGTLIYLTGGPGADGTSGIQNAPALQALVPDLDVVAPDHRGTGQSSWLGCDPAKPTQDLTPACMASLVAHYGPSVGNDFSSTQAAQDVAHLADSLRDGGRQVFIYGASYGTFLVNRYLSLYPAGVDAAILDSVVRPDGYGAFAGDAGALEYPANRVAEAIFTACGADGFCSGKLGGDPWSTLGALHGKLDSGHCASALPAGTTSASSWLKNALYLAGLTNPGAVQTALVYRLNRCAPADIAAIGFFTGPSNTLLTSSTDGVDLQGASRCLLLPDGGVTGGCGDGGRPAGASTTQTPLGSNLLVHYNIELSDAFRFRPSTSEALAADSKTYVNDEAELGGDLQIAQSWPWPLYAPSVPLQWATTTIPILVLNGTLDEKTPSYLLADAAAHFQAPGQHVVFIPNGLHGTIEHSPATASTSGRPCGLAIAGAFLANPSGSLSTTCAGEIGALDFRGSSAAAMKVFGTSDLYE